MTHTIIDEAKAYLAVYNIEEMTEEEQKAQQERFAEVDREKEHDAKLAQGMLDSRDK